MKYLYTFTARVDWRKNSRRLPRFIKVLVYADTERQALREAVKWFDYDHGTDYAAVEFLLYSTERAPEPLYVFR